jgi:cell division septation protein DedD
MQTIGRSTKVALGAAVLLFALIAAGCAGRHGQVAGAIAATPTPLAATPATAMPPIVTASAETSIEPSPSPTPAATAAASPIPTPDLTAIEALIKDITDELGAEASAGTDEGSTP